MLIQLLAQFGDLRPEVDDLAIALIQCGQHVLGLESRRDMLRAVGVPGVDAEQHHLFRLRLVGIRHQPREQVGRGLDRACLRRVVCASPSYLAAHGEPGMPADLSRLRCINFDAMSSPDAWRFQVDGVEHYVPVHSRLQVNTAEAAIDAAIAGAGVTRVLCYQIAAAQRRRALQRVLHAYEPASAPISFAYTAQRRLPLKQRVFIGFAAPRLRERLGEVG